MTIWLPWLDVGKSYRHMIDDLKDESAEKIQLHRRRTHRRQPARHAAILRQPHPEAATASRTCDLLLVQGRPRRQAD
jgi:hypothetical protein